MHRKVTIMALDRLGQEGGQKGLEALKILKEKIVKSNEKNIAKEVKAISADIKPLSEIPAGSVRATYAPQLDTAMLSRFSMPNPRMPHVNAEVMEGKAVLRKTLPNPNREATYQQLTDLKTGKLTGLYEDGYTLFEKDGKFIEKNRKDMSRAISDINSGKVEELSQRTVKDGTTVLTEDVNGNIVEKKISHWDEIKEAPQKLADDVEAINEVARYNGKHKTTATELQVKAYDAILKPFRKL